MKNDYLIKHRSVGIQEKLQSYKPDNIVLVLNELKDDDIFVSYETKGNGLWDAKQLSDISEKIIKHNAIILMDEASKYFGKNLYPIIHEFEIKLRELLYLYCSLRNEVDGSNNIKKLEEKTLNEIFGLLFCDGGFIHKSKEFIGKNRTFTKDDFLSYIVSQNEETLWNRLLGEKTAPFLRANYKKLTNDRNKVMHARYISKKDYFEIKTEYLDSLKEINGMISDALNRPEQISMGDRNSGLPYNIALENAIIEIDTFNNSISSFIERLSPIILEHQKTISPRLDAYKNAITNNN